MTHQAADPSMDPDDVLRRAIDALRWAESTCVTGDKHAPAVEACEDGDEAGFEEEDDVPEEAARRGRDHDLFADRLAGCEKLAPLQDTTETPMTTPAARLCPRYRALAAGLCAGLLAIPALALLLAGRRHLDEGTGAGVAVLAHRHHRTLLVAAHLDLDAGGRQMSPCLLELVGLARGDHVTVLGLDHAEGALLVEALGEGAGELVGHVLGDEHGAGEALAEQGAAPARGLGDVGGEGDAERGAAADLAVGAQLAARFRETLGAAGSLAPPPVFSPRTAQQVLKMLEMAAGPGGTGQKAQTVGYSVGGKSGTARKQVGKSYAAGKYRAWFTGLAPVDKPRIIVAVMVDEPSAGQVYGFAPA